VACGVDPTRSLRRADRGVDRLRVHRPPPHAHHALPHQGDATARREVPVQVRASKEAVPVAGQAVSATFWPVATEPRYSTRGVRAILARYATAAGLQHNMPPHRLRHFLFTWLKHKRFDDALIQPYSGVPTPLPHRAAEAVGEVVRPGDEHRAGRSGPESLPRTGRFAHGRPRFEPGKRTSVGIDRLTSSPYCGDHAERARTSLTNGTAALTVRAPPGRAAALRSPSMMSQIRSVMTR
jgi:hypothetical protein